MAREIDRLEEGAIRAMSTDGMTVVKTSPADQAAWYESFVSNRDRFVAAMFSTEVVKAVDRVVQSRSTP
jgi:hypothetical protein